MTTLASKAKQLTTLAIVALSLPSSRATPPLQSYDNDTLRLTSELVSQSSGVVSLDATHAVACFVVPQNEAKCFAVERSGTTLSTGAPVLIDSVAACGTNSNCWRIAPHADERDSGNSHGATWRCAAQPGQTPQPQRRACPLSTAVAGFTTCK